MLIAVCVSDISESEVKIKSSEYLKVFGWFLYKGCFCEQLGFWIFPVLCVLVLGHLSQYFLSSSVCFHIPC